MAKELNQYRVKLPAAYFHLHLSMFVLCLILKASIYVFVSLRFLPQRQKMFRAITKGKRSMNRWTGSKECHVMPEDWFSFLAGLSWPFSVLATGCRRVHFRMSCHALHPCLLIMTRLLLILHKQGSVMSQALSDLLVLWWIDGCSVITLLSQVGVLGQDIQATPLLSCGVKKEQQILERKIFV